jgi:hypothetical protein
MKDNLYKNPLFIFDFDNTIIKPEAKILIKKKNGEIIGLESHDYEKYSVDKDDIIDFTEFETNQSYKVIKKTFSRLKLLYEFYEPTRIIILSARFSPSEIIRFALIHDVPNIKIHTLGIPAGKNNGIYKASEIDEMVSDKNIDYVEYYDDRDDCIEEVKNLRTKHVNCKFKIYKVINSYDVIEC